MTTRDVFLAARVRALEDLPPWVQAACREGRLPASALPELVRALRAAGACPLLAGDAVPPRLIRAACELETARGAGTPGRNTPDEP